MSRRAATLTLAVLLFCALGITLLVWRATSEKDRAPARPATVQPPLPERPEPGDTTLDALPTEDAEPAPEVPPEPEPPRRPPPAAGLVLGTVRLADGEVPLGVAVTLRGLRGKPNTMETVADGAFRFDNVPPGRYVLGFKRDGYAPKRIWFKVHETEGAGPFDVLLTSGGAVLVRVIGAAKAPVPDQVVRITDYSGVYSSWGPRKPEGPRTDADGKVLFEHLAPGRYVLARAVVDDRGTENWERSDTRAVKVNEGETTDVTFEISCGLTGTVLGPDGQALVDAIVRLTARRPEGGYYGSLETQTDADGAYEFRECAPGAYRLSVQVLGKSPYDTTTGEVTLRAGIVLDHPVRIPSTSISGRITRADTGAPLTRQQLQITAYTVELDDNGKVVRQGYGAMAWADDNGRYTFTGLAPGTYRLWIHAWVRELNGAMRIVEFSGGSLRDVDFALEKRVEGKLRLRVLGPDGKSAPKVGFSIEVEGHMWTDVRRRRLGEGVYEFPLQVGDRKLAVDGDGCEPETVAVTIEEGKTTERTVKLRPREEKEEEQ